MEWRFGTAITIQNTGTTSVSRWNLTWTWAGNEKITQSWDATYSQSGANAKLTNEPYNAGIAPGATITGIGFNASYSGANTSPSAFWEYEGRLGSRMNALGEGQAGTSRAASTSKMMSSGF